MAADSARRNNATSALVFRDQLYAEGNFRLVYKGVYTRGQRKGQQCVCKVFKTGSAFEDSYFYHDIQVLNKTLEILNHFNAEKFINKTILINQASIWEFEYDGEKNLVEPFISEWRKYNSNTGWKRNKTPWDQVMQALSHYSYHKTGGRYVLCDLQGGLYQDGAIISDPVLHSRDRRFGPTDLGSDGISTFFATHTCNKYCLSHWAKPRAPQLIYQPTDGTTMTLDDSLTLHHRPPLTKQHLYYSR